MTFEEALAEPGSKLQASGEENDGQRVVTIYSLASGGIIWVINADGVEVFDKRRKQLDAASERATLREGRIVERSDIAHVSTWASDEYAHRGIKAALRSGEEVELVTEISLAATGDPTYSRNDLLFDSWWCTTLGRAIASWQARASRTRSERQRAAQLGPSMLSSGATHDDPCSQELRPRGGHERRRAQ